MTTAASTRPDEPRTAIALWRRQIERAGGRVAFRQHGGGAWQGTTWQEADAAAREVAGGLCALGAAPGDRVCILASTRLEWVLADVGALLAGAVTVPIYSSSTPEQCEFIIKDSGAKIVVAEDAAQIDKLRPLRGRMPGVVRIVHVAGDAALEKPDAQGRKTITLAEASAGIGDWLQTWDALRAAGRERNAGHPDEIERRTSAITPESMFTIIYTSGTTGNPKGVVLSHENLASNVSSAVRVLTLFDTDEQYLFLPLAHVLARELEWAGVTAGYCTWFSRGIPHIKADLGEVRPSFMCGVPRIFEKFYAGVLAGSKQGSALKQKLVAWAFATGKAFAADKRAGRRPPWGLSLEHDLCDKLVLGKLRARLGLDRCRFLVSGGAPLAAEIAQFFDSVGLVVLEGYGLTETVGAAYLNPLDAPRFGTVGRALDVVETRIAEDGEILVRGPSIFKQYFNNPAATAEAIDKDGWFHTGDIGRLEDGFLRITDRKKDLIVTAGGKNIAPQMLENALKARTPLVGQVLVFGDRRPYCVALVTPSDEAVKRFGGDVAKAAASPELKGELTREVEALNATLASYESIKHFALVPAEWTEASGDLTPSMKVKRKVVIEKYRAQIDGLYT